MFACANKSVLLKKIVFFCCCSIFIMAHQAHSQNRIAKDSTTYNFPVASLWIPTAFITYGVAGLHSPQLQDIDQNLNNQWRNRSGSTIIDDYLYLIPAASVYAFDVFGIEPKNPVFDRSIMLGTSFAIVFGSVKYLKNVTKVRRPDGKSLKSFPSGHTASAFVFAEFAHQELGHLSPWYSIGAYSIAGATAFLRLYNNKHWFTDVVAGAGIGILITKLVYWAYPKLKNIIFKPRKEPVALDFQMNPAWIENSVGLQISVTL